MSRYDYTPDGKLATRIWARGIATTYSYDANGALTNTVYSDGTPTISLAYNRAGRQIQAIDAAGVTTFLYDDFGAVTNETVVGVAGTNTIERFYDTFGRDAGYALNGTRQSTLAYDPATGSLVSISDAVANTEYSYSSDLLDTGYTLTLSNGEVLSRSVIRDERCRLLVTGIVSLENGNSIDSFTYAYDVLSRPTQRNCDTFCYNDRSEVTSATIAAEEPSLTSTFYGYDAIGNLTMSTSNSGSSSFAANGLNQYTSICSDFASLCEPTYDIDGNMLSNGDITFTYDSKSRLVAAAGQNGEYIVTSRYDHIDRRVQKITPEATHTYFYDGWMLIKEVVANTNGTTDVIEYHWGKDLSGTIGGAGGVGGLLYLAISNSSTPNSSTRQLYVPFYDAYGNVMGYWDAQGNVVAEYTYDAFGKLVSSSGPMSDVFSFRYSTKYYDPETGLYYYGYRFYSPDLMRWITRDPIGEEGGVNLYAACCNDLLSSFDFNGLVPYRIGTEPPPKSVTLNTTTWKSLSGNSGFIIRLKAKATALGGNLVAMPDAAAHLRHFLNNSGTEYAIRFSQMNSDSADAKAHLIRELNDALIYAERLANSSRNFSMVTTREASASNRSGNWLYAVGKYRTWAVAEVDACGNNYHMDWTFNFRDVYDWELDNGLGGGFVSDREMALLHRYGVAKEYEMIGSQTLHIKWSRGQRLNTGAKLVSPQFHDPRRKGVK